MVTNSCRVPLVALGSTRTPVPDAVLVEFVRIVAGILTLHPVGGKNPTLFVPLLPIRIPDVVDHTNFTRTSVAVVASAT